VNILDILVYQEAYNSGSTYSVGDVVNASGINYVSLLPANIGNTPVSSPTYWLSLSTPNPSSVGAQGPKELVFVNGPVNLSSVSGTVNLLTAAIPQGLWIIRAVVGDITPSLAGMGTVATIFPMYLKDADKGEYEGLFALGTSSGILLNTNQGPGVSPIVSLKAQPVVTP
jgi:hypothetical protein